MYEYQYCIALCTYQGPWKSYSAFPPWTPAPLGLHVVPRGAPTPPRAPRAAKSGHGGPRWRGAASTPRRPRNRSLSPVGGKRWDSVLLRCALGSGSCCTFRTLVRVLSAKPAPKTLPLLPPPASTGRRALCRDEGTGECIGSDFPSLPPWWRTLKQQFLSTENPLLPPLSSPPGPSAFCLSRFSASSSSSSSLLSSSCL